MQLETVMSSTTGLGDEEMHTDDKVNLDLLSKSPVTALLPLLQLMPHWGQVRVRLLRIMKPSMLHTA
jgi:hypothetical protein